MRGLLRPIARVDYFLLIDNVGIIFNLYLGVFGAGFAGFIGSVGFANLPTSVVTASARE